MKLLVIGSGLSGSVIASQFAKKNKEVLIIEKRANIGGNIYDFNKEGVMVHKYGPHIFHTSNERVYEFINQYTVLNDFKNRVEVKINDKVVPLPFNFVGIETFFPSNQESLKQKLIDKYGMDKRVSILELLNQGDQELIELANFIYQNVFVNYTSKMWGKKPEEIDKSVLSRVPVAIGYQDRYFSDKYEGIPSEGYTEMVNKILDDKNISLILNRNAKEVLTIKDNKLYYEGQVVDCPVVYSGPIDELFDYKFGVLDYRSINIEFETLEKGSFQNKAVINYPAHKTMTRITEYKKMMNASSNKTVISREYPGAFDLKSKKFNEPYYPMMNDDAREKYQQYLKLAKKVKNLHLVGRLATYRYLNMDQAILEALKTSDKLLENL